MKKVALLAGCVIAILAVGGCASGTSDVTEGGAVDKYDQMKKATENTVDKEAIDKSRN